MKQLFKILDDERLNRRYIMIGVKKFDLDYSMKDITVLLFAAFKCRKEILHLKIDDLNFKEHFASYTEHKNSSKGTQYSIHKAFWLTKEMEKLLKRIIGNRKEGLVFPGPKYARNSEEDLSFSAGHLSKTFAEVAGEVAPNKDISLMNLRQTATDIMGEAGLSDEEMDYVLGHYNVQTILDHYRDHTREAVARRLAPKTRKGIEVLSAAVNNFF
jgi:integrase